MRILFSTYALAFQNPGGGEMVFLSLRRHLMQQGHQVDVFDPWSTVPSDYDLIHHFSSLDTTYWSFFKRLAPGVPLVVTPVAHFELDQTRWLARIKSVIFAAIGAIGGNELNPRSLIYLPDLWLAATSDERKGLVDHWGISANQIRVLVNGVDDQFFSACPTLFLKEYSELGLFVLHVGRFHPVKNQHILIEAAARAGVNCVFIGSPDPEHMAYYDKCVALAQAFEQSSKKKGLKYVFIPAVQNDSELLSSAYAACRAFVLPSEFETFGIAALEAAISGCDLILTSKIRSRDIFPAETKFVSPNSITELVCVLEKLKSELPHNRKVGDLARWQKYRWDLIASDLVSIYQELRMKTRVGI